MPIRIYALAKELKIDSKELVEICTKAGIQGKGSALASLDDGEVEKVKAFLTGAAKKPAPSADRGRRGVPSEPAKYTREEYIAPVSSGKIKVIGTKPKPAAPDAKPEPADAEAARQKKKREPVISLAKVPEVKQPVPRAEPKEPPPQKPEIRLPKDAIAGHKKGLRAPLEELSKTTEKAPKSPLAGKGGLGEKKPSEVSADAPLGKAVSRSRHSRPFQEDDGVDRSLAGMAIARADRQKARKTRAKQRADEPVAEDETPRVRRRRTLTRKGTNTAAPRKGKVALDLPCTVRSFSEVAGVPSSVVQRVLLGMGVMATINAPIDDDMVPLVASELGVELELKQRASLEEAVMARIEAVTDDPASLQPRPPIVTFLGHVDHGKTSLLDRIIGTNVVASEAGGITQQIRAYKINRDGREIAFVDTPGHEAFTEMRARGANVTDIAVLVVAADDGVMPQTEEAISHAKAAGVPIVVALNKIDLPGADPNKALQQLAAKGLLPSEWGGDTEVVRTSAVTGQGINELLETIHTLAELHEYRANPDRPAQGTCLEAEQQPGRGVMAKLLVRQGSLRVGDVIVCGAGHGRVKAIYDTLGAEVRVDAAGPSTPVNVFGLDVTPQAGDTFFVLDDIVEARLLAEGRAQRSHQAGLSGRSTKVSFERFQEMLAQGRLGRPDQVVTLNLIIRADTQGSIEAILKELEKFKHPEVQLRFLQHAVGGITIGDVHLANASDAVIIGFNVIPDEAARSLAEEQQIEIRRYDIIYKLTDDIKAMLEGKLKPEERIVELGRAVIKQVFPISRVGTVAGCYVTQGTVERGCRIRVNRDARTIGDYLLESLRREKEDVREVSRGMECGMKLAGFNDIKKDDILEAYKIEEVARSL